MKETKHESAEPIIEAIADDLRLDRLARRDFYKTIFSNLILRDVAQLVARVLWEHDVAGSNPVIPTI